MTRGSRNHNTAGSSGLYMSERLQMKRLHELEQSGEKESEELKKSGSSIKKGASIRNKEPVGNDSESEESTQATKTSRGKGVGRGRRKVEEDEEDKLKPAGRNNRKPKRETKESHHDLEEVEDGKAPIIAERIAEEKVKVEDDAANKEEDVLKRESKALTDEITVSETPKTGALAARHTIKVIEAAAPSKTKSEIEARIPTPPFISDPPTTSVETTSSNLRETEKAQRMMMPPPPPPPPLNPLDKFEAWMSTLNAKIEKNEVSDNCLIVKVNFSDVLMLGLPVDSVVREIWLLHIF